MVGSRSIKSLVIKGASEPALEAMVPAGNAVSRALSSPFALGEGERSLLGASLSSGSSGMLRLFSEVPLGLKVGKKSEGALASKIDLTRYLGILRIGIRSLPELALAEELIKLVDPDEAGRLIAATAHIPCEFKHDKVTLAGTVIKGGTPITFGHAVDRKHSGYAEKYFLGGGASFGVGINVPIHERSHVIGFDDMPEEYRTEIPDIPPSGSGLVKIFEAVLRNMMLDEAMAFTASVRFAQRFKEVVGVALSSFGGEKFPEYKMDEEFNASYQSKGIEGVYNQLVRDGRYLPYKLVALYIAFLLRQGMTNFPSVDGILKEIGIPVGEDGGRPLTIESITKIIIDMFRPIVEENPVKTALVVAGALGHGGHSYDVVRYLTGVMSPREAQKFLKRDFDGMVRAIARLLGDVVQDETIQEAHVAEAKRLRQRPTPVRNGDREDIVKRPDYVADRVEVFGTLTEILCQVLSSRKEAISYWDDLMRFAELAEPESSATVYTRLLSFANEDLVKSPSGKLDDVEVGGEDIKRIWALGVSLVRSGYIKEGREVLGKVISALPDDSNEVVVSAYPVLQLGLYDIAERLLEHAIAAVHEYNEESVTRLFRFVLREFLKAISENPSKIPEGIKAKVEAELHKIWPVVIKVGPDSPMNLSYYNFIISLIYSPPFFHLALKFLREISLRDPRLDLFYLAARDAPDSLSPSERLRLFGDYMTLVDAQDGHLKERGYVEPNAALRSKALTITSPPPSIRETHFWVHHAKNAALMLFKAKDDECRRVALSYLAELSTDRSAYELVFHSEFRFGHYVPAIWRARAYIISADDLPASERKGLLETAFDDLMGMVVNVPGAKFDSDARVATSYDAPKKGHYIDRDYDLTSPEIDSARLVVVQGGLLLDSVVATLRNGYFDLAKEMVRRWTLEASETLHKKVIGFWPERPELWAKYVGSRERVIVPLTEAIVKGGEGLEQLAQRIDSDVDSGRGLFELSSLTMALRILSMPEVNRRLGSGCGPILERITRASIRRMVAATGSSDLHGIRDREGFKTLSTVISELPLPATIRDELFQYMVEQAMPETGVTLSGNWYSAFYTGAEAVHFLDIVSEGRSYLGTLATLVRKIRGSLVHVTYRPDDYAVRGSITTMMALFTRTVGSVVLGLAVYPVLGGLRDTYNYRKSLTKLMSLRSEQRDSVDVPRVAREYSACVAQRDVAGLAQKAADIMAATALDLARRFDLAQKPPMPAEARATLIGRIFTDWTHAVQSGDQELAVSLFPLWVNAVSDSDAKARTNLYYEVLGLPELALTDKRKIFAELICAGVISPYAKKLQRGFVDSGNVVKEDALYELTVPFAETFSEDIVLGSPYSSRIISNPFTTMVTVGDAFMAIALEGSDQSAQAFVDSYKYRRGFTTWHVRPDHPMDLRLFLNLYYKKQHCDENYMRAIIFILRLAQMGSSLRVLKSGVPEDYYKLVKQNLESLDLQGERYSEKYRDRIRSLLKLCGEGLKKNDDSGFDGLFFRAIKILLKTFTRMPKRSDVDGLLEAVRIDDFAEARAADKVRASSTTDLPEVFEGRDPLTRFLMTRVYMQMPSGEEQMLLREMRDTKTREASLRIFLQKGFEKLGQFLSHWWQVPPEMQQELSSLEGDVPAGDFEEARSTIIEGLLSSSDRDSILATLDPTPLGSGSVGENYAARLSDGRAVAVKVIPPTKRARFVKALGWLRETIPVINAYLEVSPNEIPGLVEAKRVLEMYLDMVRGELDLRIEAENADRLRKDLPDGVRIPNYLPGMVGQYVAVQERVSGEKLSQLPPADIEKMAERIGDAFYRQVMTGFYHSDIQSGNVLFDSEKDIVWLLDFGQIGKLNDQELDVIGEFVGEGTKESGRMVSVLEKMSVDAGAYDRDGLRTELDSIIRARRGDSDAKISDEIGAIFHAAHNHGLLIKLPFLLLLKAIVTYEGTVEKAKKCHAIEQLKAD